MKDKKLRRAVKELADAVGVSYSEYYDGSINVWKSTSLITHLASQIRDMTSRAIKDDILRRHTENKEPHVCKVCNQEIKQK